MAFGLPIRWRHITRGSAALWDVFLIPKITYIIRHCKFVSLGACIFLKKKKKKLKTTVKLEQKTRLRKNLSLNRVFHKLDNKKWKMHTGARAREQKHISIYISLCMKTFLKTGIYIYIRCQALKRRYFVWIATIWYIECFRTTKKLITWSKRAGNKKTGNPAATIVFQLLFLPVVNTER